jgi:hypothetical protein
VNNGNKLNKVYDLHQILMNLNSAKEEGTEIYMWRFVAGSKHLASVRIEAVRKQRNDFCIAPAEGQDRLVQDVVGGQTQIDLYIPSMCILMRCRLKQTDAPFRYYLELPEFIAQVERRKSLRLNVYEHQEIKVSFGKAITVPRAMSQFFLKSCFDVSAGGISFFVSKSEAKLFSPEDLIPSMELKANGLNAKIASQVLSIREVDPDEANGFPYKVWRVSCKITQIDAVAKKQLETFIFERIKDELHAING